MSYSAIIFPSDKLLQAEVNLAIVFLISIISLFVTFNFISLLLIFTSVVLKIKQANFHSLSFSANPSSNLNSENQACPFASPKYPPNLNPILIFSLSLELKISSISFIQNQRINIDDNKPKIETYTFLDSSTYNDLKNLQDEYSDYKKDMEEIIVGINNNLEELNTKVPDSTQIENNKTEFCLNAANGWTQIRGNVIPWKDEGSETITEAIINLQRNPSLSVKEIDEENNTKLNYVATLQNVEDTVIKYSTGVYITNNVLMGAAWNDYAEARITNSVPAGRVVVENGDDTLSISTERLMLGGNIISDTYGMLIGETDTAKTPIALCGRVLAYPNEDRSVYYAGAPVCTGPNGTVSIMSKDEVLHYPECIIGYVSAVPTYEDWNGKKVNGRIWIKVI